MVERKGEVPPESTKTEIKQHQEAFDAIVKHTETILPMLGHRWFIEDALNPGAGVVAGHVQSEHGGELFIPLGIVAPDGTAYSLFTPLPTKDPSYYDTSTFPLTRISFRSDEDSAQAWDIVSREKPTVGLPNRGMVADLDQLRQLKDAGIEVYSLMPKGKEQTYDAPFDIEGHIAQIRVNQQAQRAIKKQQEDK